MAERRNEPTRAQASGPQSEHVPITRRSEARGQGSAIERPGRAGGLGWYGGGSPFQMMRRMMEDMDRMFEDFGFGGALAPFGRMASGMGPMMEQPSLWTPQIEVAEREGKMVVRADLPGLRKEDIDIELQEDALILRGQRSSEHEEKKGNVSYSERSYGSFVRSIPLPQGIQPDQVDASFDNGVLEISMALPESSRRKIEIRGGAQESQAAGASATQSSPQSSALQSASAGQQPSNGPRS